MAKVRLVHIFTTNGPPYELELTRQQIIELGDAMHSKAPWVLGSVDDTEIDHVKIAGGQIVSIRVLGDASVKALVEQRAIQGIIRQR